VAVVVGDVIGKGLTAAAGMGRVRSALRALAFTDSRPAAVLTGLDRLFTATELDESLTTLVYAVVDPATGSVEMTAAGHLPLLIISPDGEPRLVEAAPGSMPLGLAEPRSQQTVLLQPGDTLIGFSDGLVENHARGFDDGLAVLLEAARGRSGEGLEALLGWLVDRLLEDQRRDDDVTVLALRITVDGTKG
jgi:serine phosphatase RsbU (regulator of sigma subunit)